MLKFTLSPSRKLLAILVLAHVITAGLIWVLDISILIKAGITIFLFCSGVFYFLQNSRWSIREFELRDDGSCSFKNHRGDWKLGKIFGTSFVSIYFTVLNLKPSDLMFVMHVVIFPDAINSEDFRKLRVWLKWKLGKALSVV